MKADKAMMLALLEQNKKHSKSLQELEEAISLNEEEVVKELAKELEVDWEDLIIPWAHACNDPEYKKWVRSGWIPDWEPEAISPIDWCVYNTSDDPAWDECLYCGMPYERK